MSSSSSRFAVAAAEEEGELDDQRGERGEEARQRHHHHVAVDHVRELVRHHAFELGGLEQFEDAARRAHGGRLLRAAHRDRRWASRSRSRTTRGLGRSACTHSRSMIPCSSGSCAGVTSLTPIVASAILSEAKSCTSRITDRHHHDHARRRRRRRTGRRRTPRRRAPAGTSSAPSGPAGRCLGRTFQGAWPWGYCRRPGSRAAKHDVAGGAAQRGRSVECDTR